MKEFDDIVVSNFVDNYNNMTLKRLSTFFWLYLQCSKSSEDMPELILKADDDYLQNLGLAIEVANVNPNVKQM